jgi:hypothetical protein
VPVQCVLLGLLEYGNPVRRNRCRLECQPNLQL